MEEEKENQAVQNRDEKNQLGIADQAAPVLDGFFSRITLH